MPMKEGTVAEVCHKVKVRVSAEQCSSIIYVMELEGSDAAEWVKMTPEQQAQYVESDVAALPRSEWDHDPVSFAFEVVEQDTVRLGIDGKPLPVVPEGQLTIDGALA